MSSECAGSSRDSCQECWLSLVEDGALAKKNYSVVPRGLSSIRGLQHQEWSGCCPQHGTCGVKWQEGRFQSGGPSWKEGGEMKMGRAM